jgi:hypothetical protein
MRQRRLHMRELAAHKSARVQEVAGSMLSRHRWPVARSAEEVPSGAAQGDSDDAQRRTMARSVKRSRAMPSDDVRRMMTLVGVHGLHRREPALNDMRPCACDMRGNLLCGMCERALGMYLAHRIDRHVSMREHACRHLSI